MTTFEFMSHAMAANDFTLYPYQGEQQLYQDSMDQDEPQISYTSYQDNAYMNSSTLDPYHTQPAYIQLDPFTYPYSDKPQAPIRSYSPADSATQSFDYSNLPVLSAPSDSGTSVQSTLSSAIGSPRAYPLPWVPSQRLSLQPDIYHEENAAFATGCAYGMMPMTEKACVDPALIQPFSPSPYAGSISAESHTYPTAPSPVPSRDTIHKSPLTVARKTGSASPYKRGQSWQPYPQQPPSRRQSTSSVTSKRSQRSHSSDDSNRELCQIPSCGRQVRDLKAHMLTHQNERPEKCPIPTCDYHIKGFARKYDKNRHTLTHYKGTMVCGFCPGSGSTAEKSFNRADVFKRHLTFVHGVEQTPLNARRKSTAAGAKKPYSGRDISGMCSTCSVTFASAQDFYEHLDDCVLRIVQQADPCEAVNEKLLGSLANDIQVQATLDKHLLPTAVDSQTSLFFDDDEDADADAAEDEEDDGNDGSYGTSTRRTSRSTRPSTKKGLTHSKNGIPLTSSSKTPSRRPRKNLPLSWGVAPEHMRMKKRVLCVFDGARRLWKDDMMLDTAHEVRVPLPGNGRAYVTDLDVQSLRRAEAVLDATEEEKGPWLEEGELENLMQ